MTSIYFPREDSLGFSGEEFQLARPGCVLSRHILIFAAVTASAPLHHNISPQKLALAYWPGQKQKGMGANEMLLYLF